jgi:hypothetical protein
MCNFFIIKGNKIMVKKKASSVMACCWDLRHEVIGIVLVLIATLMTIITYDSFGIVAMFVVGGFLICYRHGLKNICSNTQESTEIKKKVK